jgi:hypothetical protein
VNADPAGRMGDSGEDAEGISGQPTEEELRAAYEAELSRVTSTDMMAQAAVSLLNIGARRLGLVADREGAAAGEAGSEAGAGSGRDLEQVRDAIDGAKALLDILDRRIPDELRSLRDALSQLQMAYAREVQAGGTAGAPTPGGSGGQTGPAGTQQAPTGGAQQGGPGPAESSGRLWIPGQ